jgi:hypothetical protein
MTQEPTDRRRIDLFCVACATCRHPDGRPCFYKYHHFKLGKTNLNGKKFKENIGMTKKILQANCKSA